MPERILWSFQQLLLCGCQPGDGMSFFTIISEHYRLVLLESCRRCCLVIELLLVRMIGY